MKDFVLKKPKIFLFILSLLVTTLFIFIIPTEYKINESSDYLNFYLPIAKNIIYNGSYSLENKGLIYRYPPGFPIIIAIFIKLSDLIGVSFNKVIQASSVLFISASTVILYKISYIFLRKKESILAGIIFISNPLLLWLIKQTNSETYFIFFFFLAIYLVFATKKFKVNNKLMFIIIGIILGISMLIRPISLLTPLIFSLFIIKNNEKKLILYFLLGNVLIISPWEYYAYKDTNKIILLSTSGGLGIHDGLTFNVNPNKKYRTKKNFGKDIDKLQKRFYSEFISKEKTPKKLLKHLQTELKNNPITVFKFYLLKIFRSFYATDSQKKEKYIFIIQLIYLSLIIKGYFLIKKRVNKKEYIIFILAIFFYFLFMTVVALSIVRYLLPALSLLSIFISVYLSKNSKEPLIKNER